MTKNGENIFFRGREWSFHAGAAELQQRVALKEMPSHAGAQCNGALEAIGCDLRHSANDGNRDVRIEHEEHASVIFACELSHHQRAEARGRGSANRENRPAFQEGPRAASFWRLPLPRAGRKRAASAFHFPIRWRREPAGRRKYAPAIAGAWPRPRA